MPAEKMAIKCSMDEAHCDQQQLRSAHNAPMQRSASKAGFRNIFLRSKSIREERYPHRKASLISDSVIPDFSFIPQEKDTSSTFQEPRSRASVTSFKSTSRPFQRRRTLTSWDPPPLFQAYPQSVMHATLDTSSMSAASILNKEHQRGQSTGDEKSRDWGGESQTVIDVERKRDDMLNKHGRNLSTPAAGCWNRKLFVLVTSGYLLQYSAEGHHDRLPEKILQLGKDSVAFASDAISGKHWVLQVSRDSDHADQGKESAAKGMWPHLGIRSAESRRMAKSFLLIFENADDFKSWMAVVRREIEGLGGSKYLSVSTSDEQMKPTPGHGLTHRYQIQRDLPRFSPAVSASQMGPALDSVTLLDQYDPTLSQASEEIVSSRLLPRKSLGGSSIMTSTDLDRLRSSDASSVSTATVTSTNCDESNEPGLSVHGKSPIQQSASPFTTKQQLLLNVQRTNQDVLQNPVKATSGDTILSRRESTAPKVLSISTTSSENLEKKAGRDRHLSLRYSLVLPIQSNRLSQSSDMIVSTTIEPLLGKAAESKKSSEVGTQSLQRVTSEERPLSILAPLPTINVTELDCHHRGTIRPAVSSRSARHNSGSRKDGSGRQPGVIQHSTLDLDIGPFKKQGFSSESLEERRLAQRGLTPSIPSRTLNSMLESTAAAYYMSKPLPPPPLLTIPDSKQPRRPVSMQIRIARLSDCPTIPERSPAVTDAHFATCFGTQVPFQKSKLQEASALPVSVSSSAVAPSTAVLPNSSSQNASKNPLWRLRSPFTGPPPSCPLPAVPPAVKKMPRSRDILEYRAEIRQRGAFLVR